MKSLFYITEKDHLGFECGNGSYIKFFNPRRAGSLIEGHICRDYNKTGDGIFWVMQRSHVIKAEYTYADHLENKMYQDADRLMDGEVVEIMLIDRATCKELSNKQYKFKILGDFSDCGIFEEV